jgi:ribosomal protein S18 acetylase RimI-like enzyme
MNDLNIRPYHPTDLPYLMEICLATSQDGREGSSLFAEASFIGLRYVLPYLCRCPELSFVLLADSRPQGYILGAGDTRDFYHWLEESYLPELRNKFPLKEAYRSEEEAFFTNGIHQDFTQKVLDPDYPAHLHINLLPPYQGQGHGSALLRAFLQRLRSLGVPGVLLHTGAKNLQAARFYEKNGFTLLEQNAAFRKYALALH